MARWASSKLAGAAAVYHPRRRLWPYRRRSDAHEGVGNRFTLALPSFGADRARKADAHCAARVAVRARGFSHRRSPLRSPEVVAR